MKWDGSSKGTAEIMEYVRTEGEQKWATWF
jgi:hypothetical protein